MKQKKTILILGIAITLSLAIFGGISNKVFKPTSTNAQTSQGLDFNAINQRAKDNNLSPDYEKSEEIAGLIIDNLSVLYIPRELQSTTIAQVATAHLNGASAIDETSIVDSVNTLATQANAPAYAQTNVEQVKVVRTFLNRVMPDLVSVSGPMTDLEAFAVFTATISQKVDNDAFMVTPAEFTTSMGTSVTQPFPGSSASTSTVLAVDTESVKAAQMLDIVDVYINSKNMMAGGDMVSMIGIQ